MKQGPIIVPKLTMITPIIVRNKKKNKFYTNLHLDFIRLSCISEIAFISKTKMNLLTIVMVIGIVNGIQNGKSFLLPIC